VTAPALSLARTPGVSGGEPAFALLESKLSLPHGRGGLVAREAVIREMEAAAHATPLMLISAGAGWGKTTLLTQWEGRSALQGGGRAARVSPTHRRVTRAGR
jgi:hypothetical protein